MEGGGGNTTVPVFAYSLVMSRRVSLEVLSDPRVRFCGMVMIISMSRSAEETGLNDEGFRLSLRISPAGRNGQPLTPPYPVGIESINR